MVIFICWLVSIYFLCSVVQISLPKSRCCCALINSFMKLNNDCLFNCWSVVYYIYGIVLRSNGLLLLLMLLLKHSLTFNCMRIGVCLLCSFFGFVYFNASLERLLTTICITILLFFIHWNYFIIILFILLFLCCDGNETRSTFSTVACCCAAAEYWQESIVEKEGTVNCMNGACVYECEAVFAVESGV